MGRRWNEMNKCATCVYFDPAPTEWLDRPTAYGQCRRITFAKSGYVDGELGEDLAHATDGEDYEASLRVMPEFGCVLHKTK